MQRQRIKAMKKTRNNNNKDEWQAVYVILGHNGSERHHQMFYSVEQLKKSSSWRI